jgi:hypothetical protein
MESGDGESATRFLRDGTPCACLSELLIAHRCSSLQARATPSFPWVHFPRTIARLLALANTPSGSGRRIWYINRAPLIFTLVCGFFVGGIISEIVQSFLPVSLSTCQRC